VENAELAKTLAEMADLLELTGDNPYKVRAYRQASRVVDTLPGPIDDLWRRGEVGVLPGVGQGLRARIEEILGGGECREHRRLMGRVPPGVVEMLRLEGVGPKTVGAVWHALGLTDLDALRAAAEDGRLAKLPRLGPARSRRIAASIERLRHRAGRTPLHRALGYAESLTARLRKVPGVTRAEAAGSLRRRCESIGNLDLVVASPTPLPVLRAFGGMPEIARVLRADEARSEARLRSGLPVDLHVVAAQSFGVALHHFTGSRAHNAAIASRARQRGLLVGESGVFDGEGRRLAGEREQDVFRALGLPWIPPELREGEGELEAAERGELPALLEEGDLLGDLHVHSDASADGHDPVEALAREARRLGRRYLAITDHSRSRPLGLDAMQLAAQIDQVKGLGRHLPDGPRLLTGIEVDILADGSLDLPLEILAELDWVVASIHARLSDPPDKITERLVRAIQSGAVDAIGHPTGRVLGQRDAYAFDLEAVLSAAAQTGVALEINAQPERLDLNDRASRLAARRGARLAISTDAHVLGQLSNLRFGVWVARRAWLSKADVVNAGDAPRTRRAVRPVRAGIAPAE
jgi:DNA polymerase (family 10)